MDYPSLPDQGNTSRYSKDHITPIAHFLFIAWRPALATGRGGDAVGADSTGGDGGNIDFTASLPENPRETTVRFGGCGCSILTNIGSL
jgi:hypothetical protein